MSRLLCWHSAPGLFWLRIFGHGFVISSYALHRPLFSERNRYTKPLFRAFGWRVKLLGPAPSMR